MIKLKSINKKINIIISIYYICKNQAKSQKGKVYIIEFQLLKKLPLGNKGKKFIKIEDNNINFNKEFWLYCKNNSLKY